MFGLERVSKAYVSRRGKVHALRDVNLALPRGTFLTVTGPSGSGKTTMLLMLGGLIRPTGGRVLFNGTDLFSLNNARLAEYRNRKIGFVLQTFNLVPYLSAIENVMVPMIFSNGRSANGGSRARGEALLERLGLGQRRDHLPRELSVGQQQRVAIARALANDPEVILADEPTGNLDPGLSREILEILLDLNRNDGRTVIMVTHSPEAGRIGNVHVRLEDGACVSVGPADGTVAVVSGEIPDQEPQVVARG